MLFCQETIQILWMKFKYQINSICIQWKPRLTDVIIFPYEILRSLINLSINWEIKFNKAELLLFKLNKYGARNQKCLT
jgi:hypothetical protein